MNTFASLKLLSINIHSPNVDHDREDGHPQLVGDVRHAGQNARMHLWAVTRQELQQTLVADIVGRVQVEGDQIARRSAFHPQAQHRVGETVVLASGQKTKRM